MNYSYVPCRNCGTKGEFNTYIEHYSQFDAEPKAECEACGTNVGALWLQEQAKKLYPVEDSAIPDEITSEHWVPPHALNKDHSIDLKVIEAAK